VTLPRGASDQRKRPEAGANRSPTPEGTHQEEESGDLYGDRSGGIEEAEKSLKAVRRTVRKASVCPSAKHSTGHVERFVSLDPYMGSFLLKAKKASTCCVIRKS